MSFRSQCFGLVRNFHGNDFNSSNRWIWTTGFTKKIRGWVVNLLRPSIDCQINWALQIGRLIFSWILLISIARLFSSVTSQKINTYIIEKLLLLILFFFKISTKNIRTRIQRFYVLYFCANTAFFFLNNFTILQQICYCENFHNFESVNFHNFFFYRNFVKIAYIYSTRVWYTQYLIQPDTKT